MLDRDGYRPNVAIVVANGRNLVFWGKRIRDSTKRTWNADFFFNRNFFFDQPRR